MSNDINQSRLSYQLQQQKSQIDEQEAKQNKNQNQKQQVDVINDKLSNLDIENSNSSSMKVLPSIDTNDKGANKSKPKPIKKNKKQQRKLSNNVNHNSNGFKREQPMIHNKLYCEQFHHNENNSHNTLQEHHSTQDDEINQIPNNTNSNRKRRVSTKMLSKLGNEDLRSVKSHTELAETANGVRMLAKNLSKATIQLDVRAVMIVTKARDNSLIYLTSEVVEWFLKKDFDITIYVDSNLRTLKRFNADALYKKFPTKANRLIKYWDKKFALKNPEKFDLVITLGGDGTVLYASNLFQRVVPPVISFALGSLGFLTNFKFDDFENRMSNILDSGVRAYLRMRFTCRVHKANGKLVCEQQVLNELVIDRGPSPFVTNLELYGDGSLLTIAQADGLIIATPTGSTAYSLSAGGSLVHPGVSAISVTPICPHTLSFRPILLPDGMFLKVKVPNTSRSTAWCSFDGKVRTELSKGDYVTIQASPFPFPTVISSKTEYIDSVSRNLNWNVRESQKPIGKHLSGKNNEKTIKANRGGRNIVKMELKTHGEDYSLDNEYDEHFDDHNDDDEDEDDFDIDYSDQDSLPSSIQSDQDEYYDNSNINDDDDIGDDDDEDKFLPSPGDGLNTPPLTNNLPSFGAYDDRPCFAHPNAKISLNDNDPSSSTSAESDDLLTISPKALLDLGD